MRKEILRGLGVIGFGCFSAASWGYRTPITQWVQKNYVIAPIVEPVLWSSSLRPSHRSPHVPIQANQRISSGHLQMQLLRPKSEITVDGVLDWGAFVRLPNAQYEWVLELIDESRFPEISPLFKPIRRQMTTAVPRLELLQLELPPGLYSVLLREITHSGKIYSHETRQVRLLPVGEGTIRVFPRVWREKLHASQPISFHGVDANAPVHIATVAGKKIKTLQPKSDVVSWNLDDEKGIRVSPGIYVYWATDQTAKPIHAQLAILE